MSLPQCRRTALVVAGLTILSVTLSGQDPVRQQLLPTGKLRVGINASNVLTRTVGTQMARELARRLDSELMVIEYPTPGAVTQGVEAEWDIAFIAADPARAESIAFTPAYVELDATYLVRADSAIAGVADVDRPGAVIATGRTSAYTLVLSRQLRTASLAFPNEEEALAGLQSGTYTALAGLRFNLMQTAARIPTTRVLPDNITRAQQAIAVPRANLAALAYLTSFATDLKRSGFLAEAIAATKLPGVNVAP